MMRLFIQFELGKIAKYFKTKTLAKAITGLLFLGVFLFVGSGIYFFFVSGFRYINVEAVEDIRSALTLFLYELFLLVLSGIIVFSAMVSGLFNLFRSERNDWVLSTPGYKLFPRVVMLRTLMSSMLPMLVMFVPAVMAFTRIYSLGFVSLLFIVISVVLLMIVLSASTLLFLLLMSTLYYTISQKISVLRFSFGGLITILLLVIAFVVGGVWKNTSRVDLVQLFKADVASDTLSIENIGSHFSFLPTHPLAMEILHWQSGDATAAMNDSLILLLLAGALVLLWWKFSVHFYPLWQKSQEGATRTDTHGLHFSPNKVAYRFTGGRTLALFKKEALISSRNFKGVLWFLFLFFIWLAQVGTNVIVSHNIQKYQPDLSQKTAILQSLQFIIAIYFMSSFALRFVFPSFSVEKKTAWILASAPLSFKKIFFGKYLFYTSFFVALGILMSSISMGVLQLTLTRGLYSMFLFIVTTVFIVTLGLALGAIFPSLETDDPEAISTSMPGLFFTALSLVYGALSAGVLYLTLTKGNVLALGIFACVTFVLIGILLAKTPSLVKTRMFQ